MAVEILNGCVILNFCGRKERRTRNAKNNRNRWFDKDQRFRCCGL